MPATVTPQTFAESVLKDLGAPVTPARVRSIVRWVHTETRTPQDARLAPGEIHWASLAQAAATKYGISAPRLLTDIGVRPAGNVPSSGVPLGTLGAVSPATQASDAAQGEYQLGQILRSLPNPYGGSNLGNELLSMGALPRTAPAAPATGTYMAAQNSLQRLAGTTPLNVHPSLVPAGGSGEVAPAAPSSMPPSSPSSYGAPSPVPSSVGQGLTVKGQPATPSQLAYAQRIVDIGKSLHASPAATQSVITEAIAESGLGEAMGWDSQNNTYGGLLAGSTSNFGNLGGPSSPAVTDAEIKAAFQGGSGYQGGAIHLTAGRPDLLLAANQNAGAYTNGQPQFLMEAGHGTFVPEAGAILKAISAQKTRGLPPPPSTSAYPVTSQQPNFLTSSPSPVGSAAQALLAKVQNYNKEQAAAAAHVQAFMAAQGGSTQAFGGAGTTQVSIPKAMLNAAKSTPPPAGTTALQSSLLKTLGAAENPLMSNLTQVPGASGDVSKVTSGIAILTSLLAHAAQQAAQQHAPAAHPVFAPHSGLVPPAHGLALPAPPLTPTPAAALPAAPARPAPAPARPPISAVTQTVSGLAQQVAAAILAGAGKGK